MVNILLDGMVVPELIQDEANPENIYHTASKILSDNQAYEMRRLNLEE